MKTDRPVATGKAPAAREMFVCAECGPRAKADEDGCCATCGANCVAVPATSPEPVVCLSFPEDDIALIRGVPNSDDYWDNHDFCRIADMMEKYDLVPKDCGPLYAEPTPNSETKSVLREAQEITAKQAKDLGLWFKALTGREVHLQVALLELHKVIDGDDFLGNFKLADIARTALAKGD